MNRWPARFAFLVGLIAGLNLSCREARVESANTPAGTNLVTFPVMGVINELKSDGRTVVIKHQEVTNYMEAMTMPFRVKETGALAGLQAGDEISFRLLVTENESWIDQIAKTGRSFPVTNATATPSKAAPVSSGGSLLDFQFTNEFGHPISFNDFKGQAIALTFFYTRCPIPEYCPRLMKNFVEVSEKLQAMPNAPTNWHLLAISFDTKFDTPEVLRAYARRYNYDTNHWSFLTGPADKIAELGQASGAFYDAENQFANHGFRTLVLNGRGQLQMNFPVGGNLSDMLVGEILKAAAVTNSTETVKREK